jgi:hypothetical protein
MPENASFEELLCDCCLEEHEACLEAYDLCEITLNAFYAQEPMSPEAYEAFMALKPPASLSEETAAQMVDELVKVQQEVKRTHEAKTQESQGGR